MHDATKDIPYSVADEAATRELFASPEFAEAFSAAARLLGCCFLLSPAKGGDGAAALAAIRSMDVASDWPFGDAADLARAADLLARGANEGDLELGAEFGRLLRGPGKLPAPPWGSVYMDRDQVLYGWTWLALREWMRKHGVHGEYSERDPEDQFGRLLVMCAQVSLDRPDLLPELLGEHLLPWAGRFLGQFEEGARLFTYKGIAALSAATLSGVQSLAGIRPAPRRFFR